MTATWRKCPEMTHEQWLDWRRQGIGASDAPAIMEVSPWSTPFQIWESKLYGNNSQMDNSAMARGRELEPVARAQVSKLLGVELKPLNAQSATIPWLRCSLDGIDPSGKIAVEIKCPRKPDHFVEINHKVPDNYFPQLQHQMAVMGLEGMYYFSFHGDKGVIVEVERDDKYIKEQLFPKEQQFWDMVLKEEPPPLLAKDFVDRQNDFSWCEIAQKLQSVTSHIKEAELKQKKLKDQLIGLSEGKNSRNSEVSLSKSVCKGQIDYIQAFKDYLDNMRAHYPHVEFREIALEPYRRQSIVKWTLRGM